MIKSIGSREKPAVKVFTANFKTEMTDGGALVVSGYANTKNVADRYGDIPTPFGREYVYDTAEFEKNPVLLMDHYNSVRSIAGSVSEIKEDEKGLFIRASISTSDLPEVKHVRTLLEEGHLKALSIAGIFDYEDKENPNHLTLAHIFEISLVAVPADPNALVSVENGGKTAPAVAAEPGTETEDLQTEENAAQQAAQAAEEKEAAAEIDRLIQAIKGDKK